MLLYIDLDSNRFIKTPGYDKRVRRYDFKRGDADSIEIAFVRGRTRELLGGTNAISFMINEAGKYDDDPAVSLTSWTEGADSYTGSPNFNTTELDALLFNNDDSSDDITHLDMMLEVTWTTDNGSTWTSSNTVTARVHNDIIRGDEGVPTSGTPAYPPATDVMAKSVYDTGGVAADAFAMDNMTEATDAKVMTADERAAIAANTAKATNVSTDLSVGTHTASALIIESSDGNNVQLVGANVFYAGLMTSTDKDKLDTLDATADADKPVSTATQTAINAEQKLTAEESAGVIPFRLPSNVSPYTDPDADAVISATTTTDERAIAHYQRIVQTFKGMGIWASLENAYLMGSNWQSSSTTLQSITGGNTATGTGTQSAFSTTFNGTTNKYLFSNVNSGTAITGKTFVAIYKHDGAAQPCALVSNYQGGATKGMGLSVAGAVSGGTGGSLLDDVFGFATSDGSTQDVVDTVLKGSDAKYSFAAFSHLDGATALFGNEENPVRGSIATQHINNSNLCIGANPNSTYFFAGEMIFAAVFDAGLTDYEIFSLRQALNSILSDVIDLPGSIVFDGNSLTALAADGGVSGGGTAWTQKLMLKSGWSDILRNTNIAKGGARQTQEVEQEYFTQARQWLGIAGQDNLYFLWSGINDITASIATQDIIDSLKRHAKRAKAEGFRLVLITLTAVADAGDGLTYGYSTAQQTSLAAVNTWIKSEGAAIADQVIDLDEIGVANAEFLDPTDSTYYTSGDGLHHNDAGRALIADKIDDDVSYPNL